MGRLLARKIRVEGLLTVQSGLHVGGAGAELFADMPLARSGDGRLYLPGTSAAGPMRAWWKRAFGGPSVEAVWGPSTQGGTDAGRASFLRVDDAYLVRGASEIRDGVGIDRWTGTAAEKIKYDREITTAGAQFELRLTLELPAEQDELGIDLMAELETAEARLGALLEALGCGRIRFGGGKTRGLGRAKLEAAKASMLDMSKKSSVLAELMSPTEPDEATFKGLASNAAQVTPARIVGIDIVWKARLPVMMKSPRQGILVDTLPLTSGMNGEERTVLTGSGTKGALRSHSERIVRTLMGYGQGMLSGDFNKQIEPHEVVAALYGRKGERRKQKEKELREKPDFGRGALGIDDCYPKSSAVKRAHLDRIVGEQPRGGDDKHKPKTLRDLLDKTGWKDHHAATHNAIDRWTGGVADGALYGVLEPPLSGGTISMSLDLDRIPGDDAGAKQAIALLLLTLRDFRDGLIALGFGVNRGLGSLEVESIAFDCEDPSKCYGLSGEFSDLDIASLSQAWSEFAAKLSEQKEAAR